MIDDGTGLRDAELDARTIYDIACIRADASKATREDVEFKAIALRNYKAIAALSAVAPPPVLEGWVLVPRIATPEMDAAGKQALTDNGVDCIEDSDALVCYAAMLAASPAAPAQPEGGEAVAWAVINHCDNDKVGIAFEKPGAEWFARVGAAYSVRPLVYGDTRPAPAQQAVTVAALHAAQIQAVRDGDYGEANALEDEIVTLEASTAAKAAEGAK